MVPVFAAPVGQSDLAVAVGVLALMAVAPPAVAPPPPAVDAAASAVVAVAADIVVRGLPKANDRTVLPRRAVAVEGDYYLTVSDRFSVLPLL